MKYLSYFLIILGLTKNSWAQWSVQNSTTTNDLRDIEFLDDNYGVAVGDDGTILKTVDGGTTWVNMNFSSPEDLNSVALSGTDTIYAAGTGTFGPTIYRSGDAGVTWQKTLIDNTTLSVCTSPDADIFAAGNYIHHSKDGGENWVTPYTMGPTVNPFTIQAVDDQTVHMGANVAGIITYSAIIARTANGGATFWDFDVFSFPNENGLSAFSFIYPDTGYLFMNDYDFFNPNDSSQLIRVFNFQLVPALGNDSMWIFNYESINLLFGDYVNDCKFFKDKTGYAVGPKGIVYRSTDGGVTWADDYTGSTELFALSMTSENTGYAVGTGGTILKRGTATQVESDEVLNGNLSIFPNPASDQTMISLSMPNEEETTISITDLNGRVCTQEEIHILKGINQMPFDLSSLSPGVYIVSILSEKVLLTKKLEVIH